nr:serine protease [Oscillospiraceae bacterium]
MKKRIGRGLICIALLCAITVNFVSCIMVQAVDLMDGISPNKVVASGDLSRGNAAVTDFSVRLFKATDGGGNIFISPMSVLCALAMTANGAEGETLSQMEQVLGMTTDDLNEYLYSYINSLPEGRKYKLKIANSIWFSNDPLLAVNKSFLQKNADYYGAEIYKTPFNSKALWDINTWVRRETDGMIPKVLDEIPNYAIMYLINTLAFEAEWGSVYEGNQVRSGIFTKEDGTEQNAKFMYSGEGKYLEDENATGFIKYYKDDEYAFVALLPNEGVALSDYVASLDGDSLNAILSNPISTTVKTSIPKFKTEYETEMSDVLCEMGMTDAFSVTLADFSGLGSYDGQNIYIGRVLHKTYIEVAEKGTKAGAVTVVEMKAGSAGPSPEPKEVYLDRPFVYIIIDTENNVPLFIGTMTDIKV